MKRRIIEIDQDKCNGCGACAAACHEGGIAPGTPWSEVPEDFECPLCGVGKDSFEEA